MLCAERDSREIIGIEHLRANSRTIAGQAPPVMLRI